MDITTHEIQPSSESVLPGIIELLKLAIYNPASKINVTLSDKIKALIIQLIETNPSLFKEINALLLNIIKDGKIDAVDVPDFIKLLQKLYEVVHNSKDIKLSKTELADSCGIVVKFVIHTLIEEDYIKIQAERKVEFLTEIDILIDTCISLIKLSTTLKSPSCLKQLLNKKK